MAAESHGLAPPVLRRALPVVVPVILLALAVVTGCTSGSAPAPTPSSRSSVPTTAPVIGARTIATDLDVPWGIAVLPDGSALVSLRAKAKMVRIVPGTGTSGGTVTAVPTSRSDGTIAGVVPAGEGGLLGIALSPAYATDHRVYVYFTAAGDNRIARMRYLDGRLSAPEVIFSGIPKGEIHNGGRIAFGPDGMLYAGTGEGGSGTRSQDRSSLGGKILRITPDGEVPAGNPFPGSPVWTYGHRNVQGIAWDSAGRMYASEFGQDTWDELNRIVKGHDYGWPIVEGIAHHAGFTDPLLQWHTSDASPSGIAIVGDTVFLASLRGERLWRVPLDGNGSAGTPRPLLVGTYGRLRAVARAPDGGLWLLTDNTFRGTPRPGDDRLVEIPLPR